MNPRLLGLMALGIYLLALLAALPAQLFVGLLPAQLQLGAVSGSLWQGQIKRLQWQQVRLEKLDFELQLLALLRGRISYALSSPLAGDNLVRGTFWLSPLGYGAEAATLQLPANVVSPFLRLPIPLAVDGLLRADIKQLTSGSPWCDQLTAELHWHNAAVRSRMLPEPLALGPYRAQLSCAQGAIKAKLSDEGALGLSGDVQLGAERRYKLALRAEPTPALPAPVRSGLDFVAKPDGNGYLIDAEGKLP